MKLKTVISYLLVVPAFMLVLQGCDKCEETGTITFGPANQNISITYLDSAGNNYLLTRYNLFNTNVQLSTDKGRNGTFQPYNEDFSDGVFGPFEFTATPTPAKLSVFYDYVYIIKKDTFGVDTLRVQFYPSVDECKEFWGQIEYSLNGDPLPQYSGQEIVNLEIIE